MQMKNQLNQRKQSPLTGRPVDPEFRHAETLVAALAQFAANIVDADHRGVFHDADCTWWPV